MKILENGESKRLRRRSLQRRSSTVDCGALRREEAPCTRCEDDVAASIIIVILDVLLTIVITIVVVLLTIVIVIIIIITIVVTLLTIVKSRPVLGVIMTLRLAS